jgi:hypothetical protein
MAQQAYCTEHGAILVSLLGPMPRRFHTVVGLLATSCYKAQTFLCSLPLTKQKHCHLWNLELYFATVSVTRPYNHLQSQTRNRMWYVRRGITRNGIRDTILRGECFTSAAAYLYYSRGIELIQRFISKPPFDNSAVLWAACCQWRVSSTHISILASCICIT